MLTLEEAREVIANTNISDAQLMQLVEEIDTIQDKVLDEYFGEIL